MLDIEFFEFKDETFAKVPRLTDTRMALRWYRVLRSTEDADGRDPDWIITNISNAATMGEKRAGLQAWYLDQVECKAKSICTIGWPDRQLRNPGKFAARLIDIIEII